MIQSPNYRYRIIKTEYLNGVVTYTAQRPEHNYCFQVFHSYNKIVRPHHGDTYETTLEKAKEIIYWFKKEDLYSYKRYKIKQLSVVPL